MGCRFEKTLLIGNHGPMGRVPAPYRGAAIATVYSRNFAFSLIQQNTWELRSVLPVGTSELLTQQQKHESHANDNEIRIVTLQFQACPRPYEQK